MPPLTYDRLTRALAAGQRGGVFFLWGDEEFLKEEAAQRIAAAHLDPTTRDFNFDQFRGNELDPETLASRLETPPLMAEWRVVIIRDAQALASSSRLRAAIEALLERPVPGLAVVLLARIPERSRARFYQRLKRQATAIELARLSEGDVIGWLMTRAAEDGVDLEPDAARALASAVGPELAVLMRELAKLRDFVGARRRIVTSDVEVAVGRVPRENRWKWFDAVGAARFAEARAALPALLDAGESAVGLVLGLGTHFLRLALVCTGGPPALETELPPHQRWLAGRLTGQAKRWDATALDAALEDLLRADRLLKSTALGDRLILDEVLLRLQVRAQTPVAA